MKKRDFKAKVEHDKVEKPIEEKEHVHKPKRPKVVDKIDYQILVEKGFFDVGGDFFRVSVVESGGKRVAQFNIVDVQLGFGRTSQNAIDDFIRRNSSDVLDKIFDLE